jgi:hypothetical protein
METTQWKSKVLHVIKSKKFGPFSILNQIWAGKTDTIFIRVIRHGSIKDKGDLRALHPSGKRAKKAGKFEKIFLSFLLLHMFLRDIISHSVILA